MGTKNFIINEEQRKEYAAGYLLDLVVNQGKNFNVVLEGADKDLESVFVHMMALDYIDLDSDNYYRPTPKGHEKLDNLKKKYEEYLSHFDLFCAVDLERGTFAFEQIFELEDDEWERFVNQERFEDLRIAVAWFKKINPSDFVFLSFLKEGRFDTENQNWQFDLVSGLMWEKIETIIDTAIQIEDLTYYDDEAGEQIDGMQVVEDVVYEGAQLAAKLHAEEERLNQDGNQYPNDYHDKDQTTFVTTYESYYDPFYISPIWFLF